MSYLNHVREWIVRLGNIISRNLLGFQAIFSVSPLLSKPTFFGPAPARFSNPSRWSSHQRSSAAEASSSIQASSSTLIPLDRFAARFWHVSSKSCNALGEASSKNSSVGSGTRHPLVIVRHGMAVLNSGPISITYLTGLSIPGGPES